MSKTTMAWCDDVAAVFPPTFAFGNGRRISPVAAVDEDEEFEDDEDLEDLDADDDFEDDDDFDDDDDFEDDEDEDCDEDDEEY